MKKQITKEQLIQIIENWGIKKITSQEFLDWVEINYLPLHNDIGIHEPFHTQQAMDLVMGIFDSCSYKNIVPEGYQAAIDFILTSENDFEDNESLFIQCCVKSKEINIE